ncbi:aldo/keto reductase [Cellulomonas aerilata]|uniref:Oxidoreductase n=1 Tax=Cellulomonas aerilata TaxID=515326 RepID=A0A512DCI6_9CELL|nr:aldo/keto reductase [Cellulomonas aerilata]GEO34166.1 oxidoreductase [Cellulomonas aerilata]
MTGHEPDRALLPPGSDAGSRTTVFGCAALGGLYRPSSREEAHAALGAAWELGFRRFDTAPHYGVGLSEEYLGEFLRGRPRDSFTLSTKVGRLLVDDPTVADGTDGFFGAPARRRVTDYSADGVRRALEESLERLGLDRVDVVLVHDPEDHLDAAVREAAPALARLRDQGVVTGYGVGTNYAHVAERFVRETDADHVLVAGRYSLLDRRAERGLLQACAERGVQVLAGGVLNSGLLADPRPGAPFDYAPAPERLLDAARRMAAACRARGLSLRAAALQFPTRHPAVGAVVTGAGRADEVRDTVDQLRAAVPDDLWAELDTLVPDQDLLP